jgi:serine/threonine protein kinase
MPPELLDTMSCDPSAQGPQHQFAADMWALGETICRSLTGEETFDGGARSRLDYADGKRQFPVSKLEKYGSSETCICFIKSTMAARPAERITARSALSHNWVSDFHFKEEYPPSDTALR